VRQRARRAAADALGLQDAPDSVSGLGLYLLGLRVEVGLHLAHAPGQRRLAGVGVLAANRLASVLSHINLSDRPRCTYCTGPHEDSACPLRRPLFTVRDPADIPVRLRARELGADIVDWSERGYVLRTDEGGVTIGAPEQEPICVTLEQARALRTLLALPDVRRLLA